MNYDAMIRKHLKGLEETYGAITKDETRDRAREQIRMSFSRMAIPCWENVAVRPVPFVSPGMTVTATVNGDPVSVVLEPVSDHAAELPMLVPPPPAVEPDLRSAGITTFCAEEPAIEGDLPGTSGTFYAETMQTESPPTVSESAPELIGGWPNHSLAKVMGLAPNRRMLKAFLPDSRIVSVERKEPWTAGTEVKVKLMRAGSSPLYRMVG